MDRFWYNEGFIYEANRNYFLTTYHIILLTAVTIIGVLLWLIIKKLNEPKQTQMLKSIGILLLVLEALRYLNFNMAYEVTPIGALQFHLCSFGVYFSILALLFQKKWMFDLYMIHAIIGAPLALIIPLGILPWHYEYSFFVIQSFISHMLITWSIVVAQRLKVWMPTLKGYKISMLGLIISYVIAFMMSRYNYVNQNGGHTNFIWTRYPDPDFPMINDWPFPHYMIFMFLLLILVGAIYPHIFYKREVRKIKTSSYRVRLIHGKKTNHKKR